MGTTAMLCLLGAGAGSQSESDSNEGDRQAGSEHEGVFIKRQYCVKAIGLVLLLVILIRVDLRQVWQLLAESHYGYLFPVILLILPQVALRALRWQRLLARSGIDCPYRSALRYYFAAIYIGLVTPGRLGEMAKGFFLKQDGKADLSQSLPSVLLDRVLDLLFLVVVAAAALYFLDLLPMTPWAAVSCLLALVLLPWWIIKGSAADKRIGVGIGNVLGRFDRRWQDAWNVFRQSALDLVSPRLFESLLWTTLSYIVYFAQIYMIGRMINLPLGAGALIMAVVIGILIGYVPITVAGLGTREAVLIVLFGHFGVSAPVTLSFAFFYNFVYIVCVGIISAFFWLLIPHRKELTVIGEA